MYTVYIPLYIYIQYIYIYILYRNIMINAYINRWITIREEREFIVYFYNTSIFILVQSVYVLS